MRITIPFKTPTINHLYGFRGFRKFIKPEAVKLKQAIKDIVGQPEHQLYGRNLRVVVTIYEDWVYKNGEVARKDISNREKFLIDCIFECLGLDDKQIFEHRLIKMQDYEFERAEIEIEVL